MMQPSAVNPPLLEHSQARDMETQICRGTRFRLCVPIHAVPTERRGLNLVRRT